MRLSCFLRHSSLAPALIAASTIIVKRALLLKLNFVSASSYKLVANVKVKKAKYRESSQHYTLMYFLFHTGLRIGEALALTWDDINFEHAQVSVDKTCRYKDKGKEVVITSTKTTSSERIIEIDFNTLEVLKEYKKNQEDMYSKFSYYKKPENNLLFHTPTGEYWRANVI